MGTKRDREEKNGRLVIQMDTKFEDFDDKKKKKFEDDLVKITNKKKIKRKKYDSGCVLFSGTLDEASVDRLERIFSDKDNGNKYENNIDVLKFFEKYSITNLRKLEKSKLTIIIKTKFQNSQFQINDVNKYLKKMQFYLNCIKYLRSGKNKYRENWLKNYRNSKEFDGMGKFGNSDHRKDLRIKKNSIIEEIIQEIMKKYYFPLLTKTRN